MSYDIDVGSHRSNSFSHANSQTDGQVQAAARRTCAARARTAGELAYFLDVLGLASGPALAVAPEVPTHG